VNRRKTQAPDKIRRLSLRSKTLIYSSRRIRPRRKKGKSKSNSKMVQRQVARNISPRFQGRLMPRRPQARNISSRLPLSSRPRGW